MKQKDFISKIKNLSEKDLENLIKQAKKLGISQQQINQDLQLIKILKRK